MAATGTVLGLLPHVLHHVGLLAGTALIAGLGGTLLFGALGLVVMIPFLLRLRRRFTTWWAPGIALVIFAGMFALSAFVIGPAMRHAMGTSPNTSPTTPGVSDHHGHHGGG